MSETIKKDQNQDKKKPINADVKNRVITLMTASFGLVAALAWNEFIKTLVNNYLPQGSDLISLFIYAVVVTVVAVIVTRVTLRFKDTEENKKSAT